MIRHRLSPLFEPRSIALVGASDRPDSPGRMLRESLERGGFAGRIGLVNPGHAAVAGQPCAASVGELGFAPELAILAAPLRVAPRVLEACAAAGTRFVVLAAPGDDGPARAALAGQARALGVRLLGPGSVALIRPPVGLDASFAAGKASAGRVALVSQSGAVVTAMIDWSIQAGVGFSSLVALGGAIDLDFGELLDYFLFDRHTDSVLLYLEGVRDARRFMSSVRALARAKPVVIMKAGRHDGGPRAGSSHSEALTGNDRVFEAAIARAGAVRAETTFELLAAARLLALRRRPVGPRLAILTNGAGPGVIAADAVAARQLELAALSEATRAALRTRRPPARATGNPVDLAGSADGGSIEAALRALLADEGVDAALALFVPQAATPSTEAARAIAAAAAGQSKPVAAVLAGGKSVGAGRRLLDEAGLPQFLSPENAVDAFALLERFGRNQRELRQVPLAIDESFAPDVAAAQALHREARARGRTQLDEVESARLLAAFGIASPRTVVAADPAGAAGAAAAIGFPVVLKVLSPDLAHKSDVGGVRINVQSAPAAHAAAEDILESVARLRPQARVAGIVVQPMIRTRHQRELYLGLATDPTFGTVIAFGAGGVAVEQIDDVAIGLPPLDALLARSLALRPRIARVLRAYRNVPGIDFGCLEQTLVRFSALACACPWIATLDINPLVADENRVVALDARVTLADAGAPARWSGAYGHLAIHPYPVELEERIVLRDGTPALLRPIRPEDADLERAFVASLSPQTLYRRFMMPIKELSDTMIERFTQIDYDRELALVALVGDGQGTLGGPGSRFVAVARVNPTWEDGVAEFAIVVDDRLQHGGLGRELMQRLFMATRARGYHTIEGIVLAENVTMLRFCERLGFSVSVNKDDPAERIVRRRLD